MIKEIERQKESKLKIERLKELENQEIEEIKELKDLKTIARENLERIEIEEQEIIKKKNSSKFNKQIIYCFKKNTLTTFFRRC